jgi:hypothetical protein
MDQEYGAAKPTKKAGHRGQIGAGLKHSTQKARKLLHSCLDGARVLQLIKQGPLRAIPLSLRDSKFRMIIQRRDGGRYGYLITRIDSPDWTETSRDTFASVDDAATAASDALQHFRRLYELPGTTKIPANENTP